jgi:hypothetical protein
MHTISKILAYASQTYHWSLLCYWSCTIWEWRLFSFEVVIILRVTAETMPHCCTFAPATVPRVNYVFIVVINDKRGQETSVRNRIICHDKNWFWLVRSTTVTSLLTEVIRPNDSSRGKHTLRKIFVRGSTLSWAFRRLDKFCNPPPHFHGDLRNIF